MDNLNSILQSRDITLSTKVCLVKAIVFPVVMYGCESWTIKKAERHNKETSTNCQNTERTPQTQQFKQDEETEEYPADKGTG